MTKPHVGQTNLRFDNFNSSSLHLRLELVLDDGKKRLVGTVSLPQTFAGYFNLDRKPANPKSWIFPVNPLCHALEVQILENKHVIAFKQQVAKRPLKMVALVLQCPVAFGRPGQCLLPVAGKPLPAIQGSVKFSNFGQYAWKTNRKAICIKQVVWSVIGVNIHKVNDVIAKAEIFRGPSDKHSACLGNIDAVACLVCENQIANTVIVQQCANEQLVAWRKPPDTQ